MRTFPIKVHYKVIEILAARWLGTWKKALFCSLKVHTLKKFATVHSAVKLLSIFLSALRAAQHGLYTSNLLPTPMSSHVVQNLTISLSLVPVFFVFLWNFYSHHHLWMSLIVPVAIDLVTISVASQIWSDQPGCIWPHHYKWEISPQEISPYFKHCTSEVQPRVSHSPLVTMVTNMVLCSMTIANEFPYMEGGRVFTIRFKVQNNGSSQFLLHHLKIFGIWWSNGRGMTIN